MSKPSAPNAVPGNLRPPGVCSSQRMPALDAQSLTSYKADVPKALRETSIASKVSNQNYGSTDDEKKSGQIDIRLLIIIGAVVLVVLIIGVWIAFSMLQ